MSPSTLSSAMTAVYCQLPNHVFIYGFQSYVTQSERSSTCHSFVLTSHSLVSRNLNLTASSSIVYRLTTFRDQSENSEEVG